MALSNYTPSKVLVVAAHPDDEVLGCGALMAKLAAAGSEVHVLILGEGKTSRGEGQEAIEELHAEIKEAHRILGVTQTHIQNFPDNAFDSVPLIDIVKAVEEVKSQVQPEVIYTHYQGDLNIDHQLTCRAVLTATRPMAGEGVKAIYSFEILSSTEWNFPLSFSPDTFVDIEDSLQKKVEAMAAYKSELRDYPHPRSLEGIKIQAQHRGLNVGLKAAEAFKLIRSLQ